MNKTYLGDGLYASFDGFAVHVTTERTFGFGIGTVEVEIVLEPETMKALEDYWELVHKPAKQPSVYDDMTEEQKAEAHAIQVRQMMRDGA